MEDSSFDSTVVSTGTRLAMNQNLLSNPLQIGFPFTFYDQTYSQLYVSPKGFVTFDALAGAGCCNAKPIPSDQLPNAIIAAAWSNITTPVIFYRTSGSIPQRKFTVLFSNVTIADSTVLSQFQIVLYENNYIDLLFSDLGVPWFSPNITIGIESPSGTDGIQFYFGAAPSLVRTPLAVRFRVVPLSTVNFFVLPSSSNDWANCSTCYHWV